MTGDFILDELKETCRNESGSPVLHDGPRHLPLHEETGLPGFYFE